MPSQQQEERFVEAEASSKVKRALARKIRPATSLIYETGDKVFYKRNDSDKWREPATVIGKEKHQVFVKHGGIYVRVNPCHLTHVKDDVMLANAKRDTRYRKEEVHRDEIAIQNEDDDSDDSERVTETENQEEGRHGDVYKINDVYIINDQSINVLFIVTCLINC